MQAMKKAADKGVKAGKKSKTAARKIPVVISQVTKGTITKIAKINGEIKGQNQVDIYPDVPGKVQQITVREGQYVGANQVVAYIDRSQVGMTFVASPVRSPISGIIGKIYVDKGRTIAPSIPMMMIADTRIVEGILNVPEKDISYFRRWQWAEISVQSYPNLVFKGQIHKIASFIDPGSRTLAIRLRLVNTGGKLIPGNYADFAIKVKELKDQIILPINAVMDSIQYTEVFVVTKSKFKVKPQKGIDAPVGNKTALKKRSAVNQFIANLKLLVTNLFSKEQFIARRRRIKIGIHENGNVQVLEGIKPGEWVITLGKENVVDGSTLKIVERKTAKPMKK